MKFKQLYKQILNEADSEVEVNKIIKPSETTVDSKKVNYRRSESGNNIRQKPDFLTHVFGIFERELEKHYSELMSEFTAIETKLHKASKDKNSISQDSLDYASELKYRIQCIQDVFKLKQLS